MVGVSGGTEGLVFAGGGGGVINQIVEKMT